MRIVVDSREQTPLSFSRFPDVETVRGTLATGDYSIAGLEDLVALERKSLDDLVSCLMGDNRDRFERELSRARGLEFFAVLIEGSIEDVARHRYRSRMDPKAVIESVWAFVVRYRVPFMFCDNPTRAAGVAHSLLSKYVREVEMRYKAVGQAKAV